MTNRGFGALFLVTGLAVILTPRFILPVCEYAGYEPMACSTTATAEIVAGAAIVVIAVSLLLTPGKRSLRLLCGIALIAGASVVYLPEAVGYCRNVGMPCNYGTVPALRLLGTVTILASLAGFFLSLKPEGESGKDR